MESQRRPPPEDHPVPPSGRQRHDPQRGLLLQAGRLPRAAGPPHGREARPLLLPLQHRLPGGSRAAGPPARSQRLTLLPSRLSFPGGKNTAFFWFAKFYGWSYISYRYFLIEVGTFGACRSFPRRLR
ncbi:hypothetical protein EYF80_059799 [Liparis tanakae]|uniref:Uncharacterized protein n=1 Tax=Liparis tanakae TaxID=230148 RepID=A0A4Z2EMH6_9TELE|nr:hypothetical protein EYF80_059799 [Liparis tanakae]